MGLLTFTFTSEATVALYKQKVSIVRTGGGLNTKQTTTGYFVIDPESGEAFVATVNKARGAL